MNYFFYYYGNEYGDSYELNTVDGQRGRGRKYNDEGIRKLLSIIFEYTDDEIAALLTQAHTQDVPIYAKNERT
jgi:hypothetical protein